MQFVCSICAKTQSCDTCHSDNIETSNSLYCITCLNVICDRCNSIPNDLIQSYRTSCDSFYCPVCAQEYPCIVCKEHCYNDTAHQPSIRCDHCENWVHQKCSKLTINQFNRYGRIDLPYFCTPCLNKSMPFNQISNDALEKNNLTDNIVNKPSNFSTFSSSISSCSLCLECNPVCDNCDICTNPHRVCNKCINCKYIKVSELNTLISNKKTQDISFMHFNTRSLIKNLPSIKDLIYECLDNYPDVICITETKLNEKSDLSSIQIPDYTFIHNNSKTAAGGSGIYINDRLSYTLRNDLNINISGECEASFVEVHVENTNEKNIIIGSIYRHPHDNYDDFFPSLCETLILSIKTLI